MALIERQDLPVFDSIVAFQQRFGGLEYRVHRSDTGLYLGILRYPNDSVSGFEDGGRYFFECADHPYAQYRFFLDHEGTVYVSDIAIASSIEKYIESDAVLDEMARQQDHWFMVLFGLVDRDDRRVNASIDVPIIAEASDNHTTWWSDNGIRILRQVYWVEDEKLDRVVAYAPTLEGAHHVRNLLTGTTNTSELDIEIWPG